MDNISLPNTTIEEWVESYGDALYQYAYSKTGDSHTAEDLVQEAFLAALQNSSQSEKIKNQKSWLFSILRNKVVDYYRTLERQSKHQAGSYSEEDLERGNYFTKEGKWKQSGKVTIWNETNTLTSDKEFTAILDACLAKLPEQYQTIVRLKIMQNENTNDICEDLEISNTNLWQIIHRTKLRLRKCLNVHWFQK